MVADFNMARPLESDLPGYDRALATLDITPELHGTLRQAIIAGHEFRDPGRELPKLIGPLLAGQAWRWPLYDEWNARFSAAGAFPKMWPEPELDDVDEVIGPPAEAELVELFCHYLQHCAYNHAQWLRIRAASDQRPYLRLSLIPEPASVASIERELWAAADLSSAQPPTPFYPGCRASLQQLSARDLERYGYTVGDEVKELVATEPAPAPPIPISPTPEKPPAANPKPGFFSRLFGR